MRKMFLMVYRMELLRSCLHGKTVNANETFNGTIRDRIPKTRYMKYKQCQMAVHDAIMNNYVKLYYNRLSRRKRQLLFENSLTLEKE